MSERGCQLHTRAQRFAVCWNRYQPPSLKNKSGNISVLVGLWRFLVFILRKCRNIFLSDACVYYKGFSRARALPVHSWNHWGNEQTSVDVGRKSSKKDLFFCRKGHSCLVLLWPGLGLTNIVAGFVIAIICLCFEFKGQI